MQLSWYTFLFQFPGVAEVLFTRDDWRFLKGWTAGGGDLDRYREDLGRPGALTAGLNWYRANLNPQRLVEPVPEFPPIEVPVMGIWGSKDMALAEETMTGSARYVSGRWRYERFEDAGHWIPLEKAQALNELLLDFFAREPREPRNLPDVRAAIGHHTTGALAERLQGRTPDSEAE
jgi:pimeloyl-ACP methyl ester carboxylesterase